MSTGPSSRKIAKATLVLLYFLVVCLLFAGWAVLPNSKLKPAIASILGVK